MPIGPPDASFDHANFYYRNEYAGPFQADIFSSNSIGWSDMGAVSGAYVNMVARITEGTGRGQEQSIVSNTETTLSLLSSWSITPDATSVFVIAEAAWKLAAISSRSPAQFDLPYSSGSVIEVTGRAANVLNQESNPDLAPITRMALGEGKTDFGLPALPYCNLETPGGGDLTIFGVGFNDLTNTKGVTSGTLQLFYWNELKTPSAYALSQAVDGISGALNLSVPANPYAPFTGQFIQIDQEIMGIISVNATANAYLVQRGSAGTTAVPHSVGALLMHLDSSTVVMPFAAGFFDNRASNNYIHTVSVPDIRISAAEILVSNSFGNSQANLSAYVTNTSLLRTLSGGQFSLQVNGYLATQLNAAPPLLVETSHAVRDIRVTLGQAPMGYVVAVDLLQNGNEYCQLVYDPSQTTPTTIIDGTNLPPLTEGALLTINLTLTLLANYTQALNPGRDLTLTIRL
jgi:hypothetical protein